MLYLFKPYRYEWVYVLHDKYYLKYFFVAKSSFFYILLAVYNNNNKPVNPPFAKIYTNEKEYFTKPVDSAIKMFYIFIFGEKKTRPTCFTSFHKLIFPFGILFKFSYSARIYTGNVLYGMVLCWLNILYSSFYSTLYNIFSYSETIWYTRIWYVYDDDDEEHEIGKTLKDMWEFTMWCNICDYFASLHILSCSIRLETRKGERQEGIKGLCWHFYITLTFWIWLVQIETSTILLTWNQCCAADE